MPRFIRRPLTALSLATLLAAAVLWARSHAVGDTWTHRSHQRRPSDDGGAYLEVAIASAGGRLSVGVAHEPGTPSVFGWRYWAGLPSARPPALPPVAPDHGWNTSVGALGFGYASSRGPAWVITNPYTVASNPPYATGPVYGPPAERRTLTVPYWALCAGSAVLPVAAALRRRRARDPEALPCRACGYDLRATPGRCPECGGSCESRT